MIATIRSELAQQVGQKTKDTAQQEVFAYVVRHKETMPRIALIYAIEKMPPDLRRRAMA